MFRAAILALLLALPVRAQLAVAVDLTNNVGSAVDIMPWGRWATNCQLWVTFMAAGTNPATGYGDSSTNKLHFEQTNASARPVFSNQLSAGYGFFNGSSSHVYDGNQLNPLLTGGVFTICAWVRPYVTTSINQTVLAKYADSTVSDNQRQFSLGLTTTNLRFFCANTGGTFNAFWTASRGLTNGSWTHVAATFDQTLGGTNRCHLYYNGTAIPMTTPFTDTGAVIQAGTAKLSIGGIVAASGASAYFFNGDLDSVQLFNLATNLIPLESFTNSRSNYLP